MSNDVNFKKLNELEVIEEAGESTYAVVEENGVPKRIPGKKIGGGLPTGGAPYQQLVTDGEGVAKWEDRTHWKEQAQLFAGEVTVADGFSEFYMEPFVLGETYTVLFNGVEYKSVAYESKFGVCIGDVSIVSGTEPAEEFPFFCSFGGFAARSDGVYSVTIIGPRFHRINHEYLPRCVVYWDGSKYEGITGDYNFNMYKDAACTQPVMGVDSTIVNAAKNGATVVAIDPNEGQYYYAHVVYTTSNIVGVVILGTDSSGGLCDYKLFSQRPDTPS